MRGGVETGLPAVGVYLPGLYKWLNTTMTNKSPIPYSRAIADEILDRLSEGESLRAICRDRHLPCRETIHQWVMHNVEGFAAEYASARDLGLDALADEVIEIADDEPGMLPTGAKDGAAVAHNRLRFDARRWYLSKLAPKRYGDRQEVAVSGHLALSDMTEDEMRAELAALVASGVVPAGVLPPTTDDPADDAYVCDLV